LRAGLVSLLAGESSVSTLVGSRIYISKAPQKAALPHIVITQISSTEFLQIDGTGPLRFLDFDIDCKADRSIESEALGKAVRVFLDDYTGAAGSQTIGAVLMNDESTEYEPPQDGSDTGVHNTLLDVQIQYHAV